MRKTTILVVLAMAALLLVAGCSGSAESADYKYDYVPVAGAGCGFAEANEPTTSPVQAATATEAL